MTERKAASRANVLAAFSLSLTVAVMLSKVNDSLWIDEATTLYTVHGTLSEVFSRTYQYQSQTPLYYIFVWLSTRLLGLDEIGLRLPSVIFVFAAASFLYLAGRRCFTSTPQSARFLPAIFLCIAEVNDAGVNARTYSLALLCGIAAFYGAVALSEQYSGRNRSIFIASSLLCVYAHYLFAPFIAVLLVYLFVAQPTERRRLVADVLILGVGVLPLATAILHIVSRRQSINWMGPATWSQVFSLIVPAAELLIAIGAVTVVSMLGRRVPRPGEFDLKAGYFRLTLGWCIAPVVALAFVSYVGGASVLAARYCILRVAGFALLFLSGIRMFSFSEKIASYAITLFVVMNLAAQQMFPRVENWREAARVLQSHTGDGSKPLLLWDGLIESDSVSWLEDPEKQEYLRGPLLLYPVAAKVTLLPWSLNSAENRDHVIHLLDDVTAKSEVL
ncbi:MAG: glycosyltransferase family 39 protein [Bdellovibrionota bacterium]